MNPPCIRNLDQFKKKGCPRKAWDGQEGCPCWIEMSVAEKGNPLKKEIKKQCLDLWLWEFQWAMLGLLEGNQQATESFRNSMVEVAGDGKAYPKSDRGTMALLSLFQGLQERQRIAVEAELLKKIDI